VLVIWLFGWTGGKQLVEQSYTKVAEEKEQRAANKDAKRAARS
jgi:hypothetical protein